MPQLRRTSNADSTPIFPLSLSSSVLHPHPLSCSQSSTLLPFPTTSHHSLACPSRPKSPHHFSIYPPFPNPIKQIHSQSDIDRFQNSESGSNFLGFIVALSESIRGRKISDPCLQSQTLVSIVSVLKTLIQWVDEIPPVQQSARYGNLSYRVWHERLEEQSEALMRKILESDGECDYSPAIIELVPYFMDCFGNASRIDYGTGHETNLGAWLYCLARLGLLKEEDYQGVVSRVFVKYLELMRKLQLVYCLEPAGSHGFVKKVKKGLFAEHSPLLDDISGVPNWNKVNSGLLKMYRVEVLGKVPIMQHFLFGSLIKCYLIQCSFSCSAFMSLGVVSGIYLVAGNCGKGRRYSPGFLEDTSGGSRCRYSVTVVRDRPFISNGHRDVGVMVWNAIFLLLLLTSFVLLCELSLLFLAWDETLPVCLHSSSF
ncbi:Phosphotyrosyl phosphatase activator, PTPA [Dillenia turbinata]|uniref:Serine/threonine-protein phosphatase 2A activator n=1 Tax=Dillenia turbinata TaxID=194707 RepID=A0AAN8Z5W2_9MAGN